MSGLQVSLIRARSTIWQPLAFKVRRQWEHKCFSTQPRPGSKSFLRTSPMAAPSRTENVTHTDNSNICSCVCQAGPILQTAYGSGAKIQTHLYSGVKCNDELEARLKGKPFVQESKDLENQIINWSAVCSRDQKNVMGWVIGWWRGYRWQRCRAPRWQYETILIAAQQQLAQ